ncbi:heterokaryon incompatibility protein-domain-containing protein [Leptodontidium sp. MPI-SDFR-AT-0119]|nr:heterokaryon incompatibility protein-domain-containing protein [Leptodontidium sp. MPI-SDFR-AT-0119]
MDSFREDEAFDHSREPLGEILTGIKRGKGSALFDRLSCQLSQSQNSAYLMLWNDSSQGEPPSNGGFKLSHVRLLWERPKMEVTPNERKTVFTRLQVFHSRDSAPKLTPYISSHRPLHDSGSPHAFGLMGEWFQNCKSNHPVCRQTISSETMSASERHKLPTRLVDVGPPGSNVEPCLVETTGHPDGQWVALSHCWGEVQNHPLKTTRDNLVERLAGIPPSSMPKSFMDAVAVTKALGLRYIWIDSLCIIQEDEDDWLAESKHMGSVYEEAVLTIAASSAENSTKGLFIRRSYAELEVPTVQVPFINERGPGGVSEQLGEYSIGMEWRHEPFMKELDPMDTALSKRG